MHTFKLKPIVDLCKTKFNSDSYVNVTSKIIKVLLSDKKFSDYIEKEYIELWDEYMKETYYIFNKNKEYFEKSLNISLLEDLELWLKNIYTIHDTFNINNYWKLKDYNLHNIIWYFDCNFRWDITNIIDLLDWNYIIKSYKLKDDEYSFYIKKKNINRLESYCFHKIENAIAYCYSDHYNAIIKLYDNE